jgi:hypothetical protein
VASAESNALKDVPELLRAGESRPALTLGGRGRLMRLVRLHLLILRLPVLLLTVLRLCIWLCV